MSATINNNSYLIVEKSKNIKNNQIIIFKDKDGKTSLKRVVAGPGDIIEISDAKLLVNNQNVLFKNQLNSYRINSYSDSITKYIYNEFSVNTAQSSDFYNSFILNITHEQYLTLDSLPEVFITQNILPKELADTNIFPKTYKFNWNKDNFGPVTVPAKFLKIYVDKNNIPLYKDIITNDEKRTLKIENGNILIDGEIVQEYIFQNDYIFVLNDNRFIPGDSRTYGFVPKNKVKGIVFKILYSKNNDKKIIFKSPN